MNNNSVCLNKNHFKPLSRSPLVHLFSADSLEFHPNDNETSQTDKGEYYIGFL